MKIPDWLPCYGDRSYRGPCPHESAEQVTFFGVLRRKYPELGSIAVHPRNEGKRTHRQAARESAEGMTPGASDIIIPGKVTFVCEMKRRDHTKSTWQPKQLEYLEAAKSNGAFVCVALGWEAAWHALESWRQSYKS